MRLIREILLASLFLFVAERAYPASTFDVAQAQQRLLSDEDVGILPDKGKGFAKPVKPATDQGVLPAWDDLPDESRPQHEYQWRSSVLSWMRSIEGEFGIGVALLMSIWLIRRLLGATQEPVAVETEQRGPNSLLSRLQVAAHFHKWRAMRPEESKWFQIAVTISCVLLGSWFSIQRTLDPVSFDRQQRLVNLEIHPVASVVGGLLPTIVLTPLAFWMFGWILRQILAPQSAEKVLGRREFFAKQYSPDLFIFSGIVLAVAAFLLLDRWGLAWGFWPNVMLGKTFGIPYRYILLCSFVSISWGVYGHWTPGKSNSAAERTDVKPHTSD